jgi:hypothetical protein
VTDIEQLGAFYLGRTVDPATGKRTDTPVLYDAKDLTTHGVIIGMTGSGKTGLAIGLLEEAAMDRVPVIAIDPKGDLANLLLTFPELRGEDFRPWINEDAARQQGESPEAFADGQAEAWRHGLAEWGQSGERIRQLRQQAEFAVYTPGSAAGRRVSVLKSFGAPAAAVMADPDALRERLQTTVSSLLALLGIEADPLRSREHLLLSAILADAWTHGRDLDLGQLVLAIQKPPFARVGVMELEAFYPAKERFELALQLNGLLASPGFAAWMEGEPLDIPAILQAPSGRPRVAIFSIAHLGERERMFFVATLLNEILAWTRAQTGTQSLRALVYMDEIFGFFPPTANPPSKPPMLTLLKQARAFGVGLVLATQNPVDLDYKGLGNTGTWFIGRLQTERDKARILDALQGAMAGSTPMPREELDRLLSGLGKRVFLMHNVHDPAPTLFTTRWTMSYLAGPMSLAQLKRFGGETPRGEDAGTAARSAAMPAANGGVSATARPVLPPGIRESFVAPFRGADAVRYRPALLVAADVQYRSPKAGVDESRGLSVLAPFTEGPVPVDWNGATETGLSLEHLESEPVTGAAFLPLPAEASAAKSYDRWSKEAQRWIQSAAPLTLWECKARRAHSRPGESEAEFRLRLADLRRAARDEAVAKLEARYAPKLQTLAERERRARQAVERKQSEAQQDTLGAALAVGTSLLGAFFGGRRGSAASKAGTAIRSAGRAMQGRQEIAQAAETVEAVRAEQARLAEEMKAAIADVTAAFDAEDVLDELQIRPTLTGISIRLVTLLWLPEDGAGDDVGRPLWT